MSRVLIVIIYMIKSHRGTETVAVALPHKLALVEIEAIKCQPQYRLVKVFPQQRATVVARGIDILGE